MTPLKEAHDKYVPGLNFLIRENGARIIVAGRPGSGKSVLVQNLFRDHGPLYKKFDNCFIIIPENSLQSVEDHPFQGHDKIYHDIYDLTKVVDILKKKKSQYMAYKEYQEKLKLWKERQKKRKWNDDDDEPPPNPVEPARLEYSVLVIDDFGPKLKEHEIDRILKDFCSRSRHLMCQVYIICQDYRQLSMTCRKLLSHCILFAPGNQSWDVFVEEQLLEDKKEARALRRYVFNEPYNTLLVDEEKKLYKNFELIQESKLTSHPEDDEPEDEPKASHGSEWMADRGTHWQTHK